MSFVFYYVNCKIFFCLMFYFSNSFLKIMILELDFNANYKAGCSLLVPPVFILRTSIDVVHHFLKM